MDSGELKSLEEKTRAIVDALSNLEGEAKRQKDLNDSLERNRNAIEDLASELRMVAEQLAGVIDMLARSTLAEDVSCLDDIKACCGDALKGIEEIAEASNRREKDFEGRLEALEAVIGRIDRNTQKGIGKERG